MKRRKLNQRDRELIASAEDILRSNHDPARHGVGAAVRCASGRIFTGVNIEACCYGPCAEPIALGAAISAGERQFELFVAVAKRGDGFAVISPCGNCRQMILDYAPDAMVIVDDGGRVVKATAAELLPAAYRTGFDED
jgi:cytidine deaminase